ncbi:MAG: FtsK/SpoIIIE domain-containing protein [Nocardioides sp.]
MRGRVLAEAGPDVVRGPKGLRMPLWVCVTGQVLKFTARVAWWIGRRPWLWVPVATGGLVYEAAGWAGVAALWVVLVAGLVGWRRWWPVGFARWVAYPAWGVWRGLVYRRGWSVVMESIGLTGRYDSRAWLPVLVRVRSTGLVDRVTVRVLPGQTIDDWVTAAPRLAAAYGVTDCRVRRGRRARRLVLHFLVSDPFGTVPPPVPVSVTRLRVGMGEDGEPFVLDYGRHPHLLMVGATGSGKSGGQAALLAALAPTGAAVCLIDLKHGISAEPYRPRASVIAVTQTDAVKLLGDCLALGHARAEVCKALGVDKISDLPAEVRAGMPEVYVVVDEISELGLAVKVEEKTAAIEGTSNLLRCVQLLRFAGIHITVCGQRFGSSMGPRITDIRAQLPGRVCFRVDDRESADMAFKDISADAVRAALDVHPAMPGVAVVNDGPDRWRRVRMSAVSHAELAETAKAHAGRRVEWELLLAGECALDVPDTLADVVEPTPLPGINEQDEGLRGGEAA